MSDATPGKNPARRVTFLGFFLGFGGPLPPRVCSSLLWGWSLWGLGACGESPEHPGATGGAPSSGGVMAEASGGTFASSGGTSGGLSSGGLGSGGLGSGGLADSSAGGLPSGASLGAGGSEPGSGGASASGGEAGGGAGGCAAFVMPGDCEVREGEVLPSELRCTGLYQDWESKTLHCAVREYAPASALWSDGAAKKRYVSLPPGTTIDVSDPDDFVYPVGTKFWKEFYVGAEPQTLGETRLLEKTDLGWIYTSYVHDASGNGPALQENAGVVDLFGTGHSVPSREQCKTCHAGRKDYVLGWDAFLLGVGAQGITREQLYGEGLLASGDSAAPPFDSALVVPGNATESAALAYLHTNCGVSCHNETTNAAGRPSGLFLRLEVGEVDSVHTTDAMTSGLHRSPSPNAETNGLPDPGAPYYDFLPLDAERSLVLARMAIRGSGTAMPPLGSHVADTEGIALVRAWVEAMTEEAGYPAPLP